MSQRVKVLDERKLIDWLVECANLHGNLVAISKKKGDLEAETFHAGQAMAINKVIDNIQYNQDLRV